MTLVDIKKTKHAYYIKKLKLTKQNIGSQSRIYTNYMW